MILAWLVAEDDGAKRKIVSLLADRDEDLSLVKATLQGMAITYTPPVFLTMRTKTDNTLHLEQVEGLSEEDPGQKDHKEMLETLLQFV